MVCWLSLCDSIYSAQGARRLSAATLALIERELVVAYLVKGMCLIGLRFTVQREHKCLVCSMNSRVGELVNCTL